MRHEHVGAFMCLERIGMAVMRDIEDIEIGENEVAVVEHHMRNSPKHIEGVFADKDVLRTFVNNQSSLDLPHMHVRVYTLRE